MLACIPVWFLDKLILDVGLLKTDLLHPEFGHTSASRTCHHLAVQAGKFCAYRRLSLASVESVPCCHTLELCRLSQKLPFLFFSCSLLVHSLLCPKNPSETVCAKLNCKLRNVTSLLQLPVMLFFPFYNLLLLIFCKTLISSHKGIWRQILWVAVK